MTAEQQEERNRLLDAIMEIINHRDPTNERLRVAVSAALTATAIFDQIKPPGKDTAHD